MKRVQQFLLFIDSIIIALLFWGCERDHYLMEDYNRIEKIDAHVHINTANPAFLNVARKNNFRVLSINVDVPYYPSIQNQLTFVLNQKKKFGQQIAFATTFVLDGWNENDWLKKTIAYLQASLDKGAIAVKVWKNIGMDFKDRDSSFVMIDNLQFDPVFNFLAKKKIPVVGHIGEPKNCWLPIEEMTVNNDKEYFKEHKQYHMYLHPEYPSYQELINSRDHMLEKHPDLRFIGCHLGSIEWSIKELGKHFDKYPNFAVDLAARMGHLQYQSQKNREAVREFLIKYMDRIIYGSDLNTDGKEDPSFFGEKMRSQWMNDWKYLATDEIMKVPEVDGDFRALRLPKEVIDKIFRKNAEKWYPGL